MGMRDVMESVILRIALVLVLGAGAYTYGLRRGWRKGFKYGAQVTSNVALWYVGQHESERWPPITHAQLKTHLDGIILRSKP